MFFLDNTSIISYSHKNYEKNNFSAISQIKISQGTETIEWLNTYGIKFQEEYKK